MMIFSGLMEKETKEEIGTLKKVCVHAVAGDSITEVHICQKFFNDSGRAIEALYTFPMPHKASVTRFSAKVGTREIQGMLKEKEAAFKEYDEAVRKGDSAYLLQSHREDIFEVSIGNILPDESVDIDISYVEDIEVVDDTIRWTLPTVIAPRYIPGFPLPEKLGNGVAHPTSRVPDADFITPPVGDAPYTLELKVLLAVTSDVDSISSPSHAIDISMENGKPVQASLARNAELLDRDFVLLVRLSRQTGNSLLVTETGEFGRFGILQYTPELDDMAIEQSKYEYVFLLDVSGSMCGTKLEQAKSALRLCLRNLMAEDRFNIIAFESGFEAFSEQSVAYSQDSLEKADRWVCNRKGMGGTEIYAPLQYVCKQMPYDTDYKRVVLLFTDGQVGNEKEVIRLVRSNNHKMTMFSFGIDTAVNRLFIDGMAEAGNGMPEYIYPGERIEDKVIRQFSRIHQPYILDAVIQCGDNVFENTMPVIPLRMYSGETYRFIIPLEKCSGEMEDVLIKGRHMGMAYCETLAARNMHEADDKGNGVNSPRNDDACAHTRWIALRYAKQKISELEKQLESNHLMRRKGVTQEIIETSLRYGVLSTLTSFVAVYQRENRQRGMPETVTIPVHLPAEWEMEGESRYITTGFAAPACACASPVSAKSMKRSSMRMMRENTSANNLLLSKQLVDQEIVMNEAYQIDTIDHWIRTAATMQNADGSFTANKEMTSCGCTALFIWAMLILKDQWKPYKIQIEKAGKYIIGQLKREMDILGISPTPNATVKASEGLVVLFALRQLADNGLLKLKDTQDIISGLEKRLDNSEGNIYNEVLGGQMGSLYALFDASEDQGVVELSRIMLRSIVV